MGPLLGKHSFRAVLPLSYLLIPQDFTRLAQIPGTSKNAVQLPLGAYDELHQLSQISPFANAMSGSATGRVTAEAQLCPGTFP